MRRHSIEVSAVFGKRTAGLALGLIPCLYITLFILRIFAQPDQYLWDFHSNYFWTKAFRDAINPYDVKTATSLMSPWKPPFGELTPPAYPFVYTPLSMFFFAPFTFMNYETARIAALVFYTVVLLGTLIFSLRRLLGKSDYGVLYLVFVLLAFSGAVNKSIQTGNVASLETALILMGILCWLRGRHTWFMCLILASSVFKLTPLFFLGLVLFDKAPRWRSVAIALLGFLSMVALSMRIMPVSLVEWLPFAGSYIVCWPLTEGPIVPSMFCMLNEFLSRGVFSSFPAALKTAVFGLFAASILFITARKGLYLARVEESQERSRGDLAVLAILCYALVLPRLADYAWVLLIPAVFRVLIVREYAKTVGPLMVLCLLPHREDTFPGLNLFFKVAAVYSPAIVAFGAWLLLVLNIGKKHNKIPT